MAQTHWQHRLQCWRTAGLAQGECCKPALKRQLFWSPGWPSRAEHHSEVAGSSWGRQKMKTSWKWSQLLSSATAKPGERGTPTMVFQEQQCWAVVTGSSRKLSQVRWRRQTTAQGLHTSGYCWWLGKSSKHLFPQSHTPRGSTALRAHSNTAWPRYTELLPKTHSVLLSYKRMKIWL